MKNLYLSKQNYSSVKHSQRFIVRYNNHKEPNSPGPLTLKPCLTAIAADFTAAVTDAVNVVVADPLDIFAIQRNNESCAQRSNFKRMTHIMS